MEQVQLNSYFKALADDTRLRMIGLLANGEQTVRELATQLGVKEPTVSHHLSTLRGIGFVNLRTDGNQHFYRLNPQNLARFKAAVANMEQFAATLHEESNNEWIDDLPLADGDKKVLRDYIVNGKLSQIPMKQSKLLAILNWLVLQFESGVIYTERDVNAIITRYHNDYATLRRNLIEFGYLRRERGGSKYWVTPEGEQTQPEG